MTTQTAVQTAPVPPSQWQLFAATFFRNKGAVLGLVVLIIMVISALLAPLLAPHDPYQLFTGKEQLPPAFLGGEAAFPLGTDDAGRDLMSYPSLLLAIIIAAILGPSMTNTIITIALVCMPPFIRLTRATAMVELQRDYFTASKVMGAGTLRLLFVTILPNCMAPLIVQATMIFSTAILEAGAIGFLGFGVQPPDAEWGAMLGTARQYIQSNVWLAIWPGLSVFLAALSINLTGDGLRDALDPKLKQVS